MNLNESSHKTLTSLEGFEGVLKKEIVLDSGRILIYDVGVDARLSKKNSLNVGLLTAKASTGCLADFSTKKDCIAVSINPNVALATLGCQMAGWAIDLDGERAMASGPARILARKPKAVFEKINYSESSQKAALILESNKIPAEQALMYIMDKTGASEVAIAVFKGDSKVGLINVLARVVELAVYRLDFLGYDVNNIISARGQVRIPRKAGMCEANDALIYNSNVELKVKKWDNKLADKCTSKSSKCYGQKFREIYEKAGCNFYNIDESIFAPAEVRIIEVDS
ncbi:MAG: methenyltetrahydromethanopterin cyclohydrolase [Candidatus Altiarchaeota archaeon]